MPLQRCFTPAIAFEIHPMGNSTSVFSTCMPNNDSGPKPQQNPPNNFTAAEAEKDRLQKPLPQHFSRSANNDEKQIQSKEQDFSPTETVLTIARDGIDGDLDAVILHVKYLLNKAKGSPSAEKREPDFRKLKSFEYSQLAKVKELLSESSEGASDLKSSISSHQSTDLLKSAAKTVLKAIGKAHWVAAGVLVVWFVLERFDRISSNQRECLNLLDEMHRLSKYVNEVKQRPQIRRKMEEIIEECLQLVVQGAILCCSCSQSSRWSKFIGSSVDAERLKTLRNELDKAYRHLMLQMIMCVCDAEQGIQFVRQKLYPRNAVGIDTRLREILEMLEFESEKNVVAVIMYGFGGIGKTTLGDAVYASVDVKGFNYSKVSLFDNFQSTPVVTKVQKAILDDLSYADSAMEHKEPASHTQGQVTLCETFQNKACFVFIDNVLDAVELKRLLPDNLNASKKLRLLLASRDASIREGLDIENLEDVKLFNVSSLPPRDASIFLQRQLGKYANEIKAVDMDYLLTICGGVPLCLELVGRYIRYEPDKRKAFNVIRDEHDRGDGQRFGMKNLDFFAFAFNGLQEAYRDAFLDICAFLIHLPFTWQLYERILGEEVLEVLEKRALIKRKFSEYYRGVSSVKMDWEEDMEIQVHDVILEIGKRILRQEGSRITNAQQLRSLSQGHHNEAVLRGVKGIHMLDIHDLAEGETLKLSAEKLDIMSSSLRIFSDVFNRHRNEMAVRVIGIEGECKSTFRKLLSWESIQTEPPFNITKSPELKFMSYSPTKPVDLSQMPVSLRMLHIYLENCVEEGLPLQILAENKLILPKLETLLISSSSRLSRLPEGVFSNLKSLKDLYITDFPQLLDLPNDLHYLSSLKTLVIRNCKMIKRLPNDIERCLFLKSIELTGCENLQELPDSLIRLSSLESLYIHRCRNLRKLAENYENLSSLKALFIDGCENLVELGDRFRSLSSLRVLELSRCNKLQGKWIDNITSMKALRAVFMYGSFPLIHRWKEIEMEDTDVKFYY